MSFEDIPEDKEESYPCPECESGSTDQCDFISGSVFDHGILLHYAY